MRNYTGNFAAVDRSIEIALDMNLQISIRTLLNIQKCLLNLVWPPALRCRIVIETSKPYLFLSYRCQQDSFVLPFSDGEAYYCETMCFAIICSKSFASMQL
jgi:hypothetical protein